MDASRATRIVWTINGLVDRLSNLQRERSYPRGAIVGESASMIDRQTIQAQHLEYDRPERIADSEYLVTSVYAGSETVEAKHDALIPQREHLNT